MKFGLKALFVATALLAFLLAAITSVAPKFDREKQQIVVSSWLPIRTVILKKTNRCLYVYWDEEEEREKFFSRWGKEVRCDLSSKSPALFIIIDLYFYSVFYEIEQDARPDHKVMWCDFKRCWSDPRYRYPGFPAHRLGEGIVD